MLSDNILIFFVNCEFVILCSAESEHFMHLDLAQIVRTFQVFWEIAVANSRDRTIGGILPVWFGLGIAIGSCGFAIVSAGDLWSIRFRSAIPKGSHSEGSAILQPSFMVVAGNSS